MHGVTGVALDLVTDPLGKKPRKITIAGVAMVIDEVVGATIAPVGTCCCAPPSSSAERALHLRAWAGDPAQDILSQNILCLRHFVRWIPKPRCG